MSVFAMLEEYQKKNRISFSMPGHKGGRGFGEYSGVFSMDVTELADTDNLYADGGAVARARKKAAEFFGAEKTYFLTNGATGGIYTMLAATCRRGDTVLVNRGCHSAVINACTMLGLVPVFAEQLQIPGFSLINAVTPAEIEKQLKNHTVQAVLITSPNYYGVCADVEKIAKITHQYGIPLLVDEAHGAHFAVEPALFPKTAMVSGADLAVQSAHKTLNAPNQTAYLHVRSKIVDKKRLQDCVEMLQTSSPSYIFAGFLDRARAELAGENRWKEVYTACVELKKSIKEKTAIRILDIETPNVFAIDATRLVFNISAYETTGFAVADILRNQHNIDVEMADLYNIVCIVTAANTKSEIEILKKALTEITKTLPRRKTPVLSGEIPKAEIKMPPAAAFDAPGEWTELIAATGRISKSIVSVYPPGIPVLFPGAVVSGETVEYLQAYQHAGATINGIEQGKIYIVK